MGNNTLQYITYKYTELTFLPFWLANGRCKWTNVFKNLQHRFKEELARSFRRANERLLRIAWTSTHPLPQTSADQTTVDTSSNYSDWLLCNSICLGHPTLISTPYKSPCPTQSGSKFHPLIDKCDKWNGRGGLQTGERGRWGDKVYRWIIQNENTEEIDLGAKIWY